MTNEQILQKAIEKAVKNGWDEKNKTYWMAQTLVILDKWIEFNDCFGVIYSHDFAKAFWGEKDYWKTTKCDCGGIDFHTGNFDAHRLDCSRCKAERGYKFHLSKMVIEPEPLKYLEGFL